MSFVIVFPSHQTSLAERGRRILARSVRPASAASGSPARARRVGVRRARTPIRYKHCKHALREGIAIASRESKGVLLGAAELRVELLLQLAPGPREARFYGLSCDLQCFRSFLGT